MRKIIGASAILVSFIAGFYVWLWLTLDTVDALSAVGTASASFTAWKLATIFLICPAIGTSIFLAGGSNGIAISGVEREED